eukprot:8838852-Pyramimonas_sp.AAC.1
MVFWEHEEHEVAYCWPWAFKMWPGNGVLVPGSQSVGWDRVLGSPRIPPASAQTPLGSQDALFRL